MNSLIYIRFPHDICPKITRWHMDTDQGQDIGLLKAQQ